MGVRIPGGVTLMAWEKERVWCLLCSNRASHTHAPMPHG